MNAFGVVATLIICATLIIVTLIITGIIREGFANRAARDQTVADQELKLAQMYGQTPARGVRTILPRETPLPQVQPDDDTVRLPPISTSFPDLRS
jgi:hypothetical protein